MAPLPHIPTTTHSSNLKTEWRSPLTKGMISFAVKKPLTKKENAHGQVYQFGRPCVNLLHCCRPRPQWSEIEMSGHNVYPSFRIKLVARSIYFRRDTRLSRSCQTQQRYQ